MSEKHLTDQLFKTLNLAEPLMQGLAEAGFEHCTPIQAAALPALLDGRDVAGQAQTGTGKTATFLLAAMHRLLARPAAAERKANQPRTVIVAPTRELALQIHRDAVQLGRHTGLRLGLAYGGTGYQSQRETIEQGIDILIGTPGRLIDYYKQQVYDLKAVEIAIIDEADRMFDLGFIADIRYMLRRMPGPAERLSLLFSATLSHRVMELAYEHMNDPQLIKIDSDRLLVENVTEQVFYPANEEKIPLLIGMLNQLQSERIMVFVNTKHGGETVQNWLHANHIEAGLLTGDVPQPKRERLLREFTGDRLEVLVATDVAARGLHIPNVSHVINFDLPFDAEDYVHRIGRTARAGASGDAISFACERYAYSQMDIEDYIGHSLPRSEITPTLLASNLTAPRRSPPRNRRETRPARRDAAPHRQPARPQRTPPKPAARPDTHHDRAPQVTDPTPAARPAVATQADPALRRARRRQPEIPAIG